MTPMLRLCPRALLLFVVAFALAGCRSVHFESPEMQGPAAMVDDAGQPRLWVLSKQEETRQVSVGTPGNRGVPDWRTDTFFHFSVQAFDPATARPLWKRRLLTLGDDEAGPNDRTSRVIGSSVDARLLGQEGGLVWLLVGAEPFAVDAHDGHVVVDAQGLQQRNPALKGLLPSEAKHYGFDRGLVLRAADARQFVVRGAQLQATDYAPPPPPTEVAVQRPGARRTIVPMRPLGEVPARNVMLDGQWLGLYSDKEAADAGDDPWGENLDYPYSILDEGAMARRTFWHANIVAAQSFDDHFKRLDALTPVPGAPTFLKGRFLETPGTDQALLLDDPAGLLVWHSTRIDSAGRLAVTRLDTRLQPLWTAELPLSEQTIVNPVVHWLLPGHLVVMGDLQSEDDHVHTREPHLVGIDLADGSVQAWNMTREAAAGGAGGD